MAKKIEVIEDDEHWPICPYCDKELHEIWVKAYDPWFGKDRFVFFCPHCRRILSIEIQT